MKNVLTVVIVMLMFALVGGLVLAQSSNDLFQQALVKERAGSYQEAIKIYQTIVQKNSSDRKLAAKALFQMGQAYEKLGNAEARKTYERITKEYADQKEVAVDAGRRLTALGIPQVTAQTGKMTERLLWTDAEEMRLKSITPDGHWMGMGHRNHSTVRDLLTGEATLDISDSDPPLISSDGKTIVYNFFGTDSLRPNKSLPAQLRLISVAPGGRPRVLYSNEEIAYSSPFAWSRDGNSILLEMRKTDRTWQLGWIQVSDGSVQVLKSLEWRLCGFERHASLSPDGRYIAYAALVKNPSEACGATDTDDRDIYIISSDGKKEKALTKSGGINDGPVWTPDGNRIVFTSDRSGTFDLYSVLVRDGEGTGFPSLVKKDVGRIQPLDRMTQTGTLYFTVAPQNEIRIAEMDPENITFKGYGTNLTESFTGLRPTWSPNGDSIAFTKERSSGYKSTYDLNVRSMSTGKTRTYLTGDAPTPLGQVVQWFHDSMSLLLVRNTSTGLPFYRVDLESGGFSEVAGSSGGLGAVSPDNNVIYLRASDSVTRDTVTREIIGRIDRIVPVQIVRSAKDVSRIAIAPDADALNKESREAVNSPERPRHGYIVPDGASDFSLSPDGRTIALISWPDAKTGEVYLARVNAADGSGYQRLYGPFRSDTLGHKILWTKDGRTILFGQSDGNDHWQIMRISSEGGKADSAGLEVERLRNFDLSPNGSRIAFEIQPDWVTEIRSIDNISTISSAGR